VFLKISQNSYGGYFREVKTEPLETFFI
jgi:hypothetical protein